MKELQPSSWLGIEGEGDEVVYESGAPGGTREDSDRSKEVSLMPHPRRLAYVCNIKKLPGSTFPQFPVLGT